MLGRRELAGLAAVLACLATRLAAAAPPNGLDTSRRQRMSNANEIVVNYLAAWNERDARRRGEIIARTWGERGVYVDAHRRGEGHAGIDTMIAAAQAQFPGYRLRLVSKVEAHNGRIRFSWAAGGTEEAPLYLAGTDFVVLGADGRADTVTGFVDAAPAPMT